MLGLQLSVIATTPTNVVRSVMANLEAHLKYQVKMEQAGACALAGPDRENDKEAWMGDGMIVVLVKNLTEARQVAENHPMHSSGVRKFTVRPWLVNEGTVSARMNFSKMTLQVA